MELFKNTNYDFLGKKWPFIIASLVLSVAGLDQHRAEGRAALRDRFQGRHADDGEVCRYAPDRQDPHGAVSKESTGEVSVQNLRQQASERGRDRHGAGGRAAARPEPPGHAGHAGSDLRPARERQAGLQQRRRTRRWRTACGTRWRGNNVAMSEQQLQKLVDGSAGFPRHAAALRPDHEFRSTCRPCRA